MESFEKKPILPPIEIMIALAVNLVVVIFGYYVVMMWDLSGE